MKGKILNKFTLVFLAVLFIRSLAVFAQGPGEIPRYIEEMEQRADEARNSLWRTYFIAEDAREVIDAKRKYFLMEREKMLQKNLSIVRDIALDYYQNRDKDEQARYNLSRLVMSDPAILDSLAVSDYSLDAALEDLYRLAEQGHAGAQFGIGKAIYKTQADSISGKWLVQSSRQGNVLAHQFLSASRKTTYQWPEGQPSLIHLKMNKINGMEKQSEIKPEILELRDAILREIYSERFLWVDKWAYFGNYCSPLKKILLNEYRIFSKNPDKFLRENTHPIWLLIASYAGSYGRSMTNEKITLHYEQFVNNQEGTPKTTDLNILAEIYSEGIWTKRVNAKPSPTSTIDLKKAKVYFEAAEKQGSPYAALRLGMAYKSGLLGEIDTLKAIHYLDKAHKEGSDQAVSELAPIFVSENSSFKNMDKATDIYLSAIDQKHYFLGYEGLRQINYQKLRDLQPFEHRITLNQKYPSMDLMDTSKQAIVHLIQGNFWEENYYNTINLIKNWGNNPHIRLILATTDNYSLDPLLLEALGYRGVLFVVEQPERSPKYQHLYDNFDRKFMGNFFRYENMILSKRGYIFPEFDARWTEQGWPSTFVYVKGRQSIFESVYFDAVSNYSEIDKLLRYITSDDFLDQFSDSSLSMK